MKAQDILNNVMVALGLEPQAPAQQVNFEQRKQADGDSVFEAETFEVGSAVFVTAEDGERMPVPEGTYTLEDGMTMVVDDQGVIASIGEAQEQPPANAPKEEEEVVASANPPVANPKKVVESQVRETHFSAEEMTAVKVELEKVVTEFENEKAQWDKERVELTAEIDALKEKLAEEPAVDPLTHNVEGNAPQKVAFKSRNWKQTTQDRVYRRMSNS